MQGRRRPITAMEQSKPAVHSALFASHRLAQVRRVFKGYYELTKPRIMLMLLFTEYAAMVVAAHRFPSAKISLFALIGLALSTGSAATMNMWYDRDIDAVMNRTSKRPIPAGEIQPTHAFWFGIVLLIIAMVELIWAVNLLTAAMALAGYVYYVVFYTMWLKRRTVQNIVIGGGAGAFPPIVGWCAVTNHLSWPAFLMFLIIFLWTPPHFWALALYKQEDYRRANIPMMPVIKGDRVTKIQSTVYAVLLLVCSIVLYFTRTVGVWYLIAAILLGSCFVFYTLRSFQEKESFVWAKRTFKFSLFYLPVLFVFMIFNKTH